ncbi:Rrf2 family transcriptional regulator, group III [Deinococcus saxicola]|uniref:Rrf2 family transcriptional regulator n=1 Tax=Deinococcus saxicola TaxID=249406 RepID=UPI0039F11B65
MNSEYSIAVHILSLLNQGDGPHSSEYIAGSVGVNPVVVRNVTGRLRRAGLLHTRRGVIGATLTRRADQITLLDVYRAVDAPRSTLKIHQKPNPNCPVGASIQCVLDGVFAQAQAALEQRLAQVTLAEITSALHERAS